MEGPADVFRTFPLEPVLVGCVLTTGRRFLRIATARDGSDAMDRYAASGTRSGARRCWFLAAVLVSLLAVGGCESADEPGTIPLLREPHLGTPLTLSMAGHLKASPYGGCLIFVTDEQVPYSVIFDENLAIEVTDDELYLDGKGLGPVGTTGVKVAVLGRDGPITNDYGNVTGPVERTCNQTQPIVVEQVRALS